MVSAVALACGAAACGSGGETGSTGGAGATGGSSSETSSTTTSTTGAGGSTTGAYNKLWIPDTLSGKTFNLTLSPSTKQVRPGAKTTTYGYNGADFWGPTLIMNKGDLVQMHVTNNLAEDTTAHWHGFHIPAIMDGGPHQPIAPGATWSPSFEVKNRAGMYWYHPHLHLMTEEQMTHGAGGLILVEDAEEAALPLPRTYGVDDIPWC